MHYYERIKNLRNFLTKIQKMSVPVKGVTLVHLFALNKA